MRKRQASTSTKTLKRPCPTPKVPASNGEFQLTPELCKQLQDLYLNELECDNVALENGFIDLGIPNRNSIVKRTFTPHPTVAETMIATSVSSFFYETIKAIIMSYIGTPTEIFHEKIIRSLVLHKCLRSFVALAEKEGPTSMLITLITTHGVRAMESDFVYLVREFCRFGGKPALEYFLCNCWPLTSRCGVSVKITLLLEAVYDALDILHLLEVPSWMKK